jgi:hypothetical protein
MVPEPWWSVVGRETTRTYRPLDISACWRGGILLSVKLACVPLTDRDFFPTATVGSDGGLGRRIMASKTPAELRQMGAT